jgi:hypothetical protein
MNTYLHKVNNYGTIDKGTPRVTYRISCYMECGDGYHDHPMHMFKSANTVSVLKLLKLFKLLDRLVKVSYITENSFVFQAINGNKVKMQKVFFKLCRYVRNADLNSVLDKMITLIEQGVKPYNAIMLAHLLANRDIACRSSMDIVNPNMYDNRTFRVYHTYRSWNQFLYVCNLRQSQRYIENTYTKMAVNKAIKRSVIVDMLKDPTKVLELQRMLLISRRK